MHHRFLPHAAVCAALIGLLGCGDNVANEEQPKDVKASVDVVVDASHVDVPTVDTVADVPDSGPPAACKEASECPQPTEACRVATCEGGGAPGSKCGFADAADDSKCDDGDKCTDPDVCKAGKCEGPGICECQQQADCDAKHDGNPCNPTWFCDDSVNKCVINPGSVVKCPDFSPGVCLMWACDSSDGECKGFPDDTAPCKDDDPCTAKSACKGGKCVQTEVDKGKCGCQSDAECTKAAGGPDDDNPCTGVYFCATDGTCKLNKSTVVKCNFFNKSQCHHEACDPKDGKCKVVHDKPPLHDNPVPDDQKSNCESDGTHCTQERCKAGKCTFIALLNPCGCSKHADCKTLDDDDACNGTYYCQKLKNKGTCLINPASTVSCPTIGDGPCVKAACDPKTGDCNLKNHPDTTKCLDGNPCTLTAQCKSGKCEMTTTKCACTKNADCSKHEPDIEDKCLGTKLYCDIAAGACKINPATAPVCGTLGDTACLKTRCDGKDGKCKPVPEPNGKHCDGDGTLCTFPDTCEGGTCVVPPSQCSCTNDGDCADQEDGNPCNGTLMCDKSKPDVKAWGCVLNPATIKSCSGGTACTPKVCDPKDGKCHDNAEPDGHPCEEDGSKCSLEKCKGGKCVIDVNICTCPKGDDCADFEDGNPCNGTMFCDKAGADKGKWRCKVNPKSVITCKASGGAVCQKEICDPKDGKCKSEAFNEGAPCFDDSICTKSEFCKEGTCVQPPGGATLTCDDAYACSADSCDAFMGCVFKRLDGNACTDGDACTTGDKCANKGGPAICEAGSAADCNDDNGCTDDACDSKTGCTNKARFGACEDGNACTVGDTCGAEGQPAEHVCLAGKVTSCDDGNACTDDSCDPKAKGGSGPGGKGGCIALPNKATCSDGDACTLGDACEAGACKPGQGGGKLECKDNGDCKAVGCDAVKGCTYKGGDKEICDGKLNVCGGKVDAGCDDDGDGHCDQDMEVKAGATCKGTTNPAKTGCPLILDPAITQPNASRTLDFGAGGADTPQLLHHGGRGELWEVRSLRNRKATARIRRFDAAGALQGIFDTGRLDLQQVAADPKADAWYAVRKLTDADGVTSTPVSRFKGASGTLVWTATATDGGGKAASVRAIAADATTVWVANLKTADVYGFAAADGKTASGFKLDRPGGAAPVRWITFAWDRLLVAHEHQENSSGKTVARAFELTAGKATVKGSPITFFMGVIDAPASVGAEVCTTGSNGKHICQGLAKGVCTKGDDCDDGDEARAPGLSEVCNGKDDDCDSAKDEGCDADLDGFCSKGMKVLDGAPCKSDIVAGKASVGTDCHDGDFASNSKGVELCDQLDNDCDGKTDDGCDGDGDGFCAASKKVLATATCRGTLATESTRCKGSKPRDGDVWKVRELTLQPGSSGLNLTGWAFAWMEQKQQLWAVQRFAKGKSGIAAFTTAGALLAKGEIAAVGVSDMDAVDGNEPVLYLATADNGVRAWDSNKQQAAWDSAQKNATVVSADGARVWAGFTGIKKVLALDRGTGKVVAGAEIDVPTDGHWMGVVRAGRLFWGGSGVAKRYKTAGGAFEHDAFATKIGTNSAIRGELCVSQVQGAGVKSLKLACYNVLQPVCTGGGDDCADTDGKVKPADQDAICDGKDDNCDGVKDDGCDVDGDKYCAAGKTVVAGALCTKTTSDGKFDCDDHEDVHNPGATEVCSGADVDCDGKVDEGCDDDGDGFCDAKMGVRTGATCTKTLGYLSRCKGGGDKVDYVGGDKPGTFTLAAGADHNHPAMLDAAHAAGGAHVFRDEYWFVRKPDGAKAAYVVQRYGAVASKAGALTLRGSFGLGATPRPAALVGDVKSDAWFACHGPDGHNSNHTVTWYEGLGVGKRVASRGVGACVAAWADGDSLYVVLASNKARLVRLDINRTKRSLDDNNVVTMQGSPEIGAFGMVNNRWVFADKDHTPQLYGVDGTKEKALPDAGDHVFSFFAAPHLWGKTTTNATKGAPQFEVIGTLLGSCDSGGDDCDDTNAAINPTAERACDGKDNDCDGRKDEGCDVDGDGYCGMDMEAWPGGPCTKSVGFRCRGPTDLYTRGYVTGRTCYFSDRTALREFGDGGVAANAKCITNGAKLVHIHSAEENEASRRALLLSGYTQGAWIGLSDVGVDDTYAWLDKSKVDYANWKTGGKKAGGNGVTINTDGKWEDQPTSPKRRFVCRIDQVHDCDDDNKLSFPSGEEICDGKDNNCNGKIDEGCDDDGDTFCSAAKKVVAGATCAGSFGKDGKCGKPTFTIGVGDAVKHNPDSSMGSGWMAWFGYRNIWVFKKGNLVHKLDAQGKSTGTLGINVQGVFTCAADADEIYSTNKDARDVGSGKAHKYHAATKKLMWQSQDTFHSPPAITKNHLWLVRNRDTGELWRLTRLIGKKDGDAITVKMTAGKAHALAWINNRLVVAARSPRRLDRFDLTCKHERSETYSASGTDLALISVYGDSLCFTTQPPNSGGGAWCNTLVTQTPCAKAGDDCNDGDHEIKPGPEPVCDGQDQNCDGVADDGCDEDGDGFCKAGPKVVNGAKCDLTKRDCDDDNKDANPDSSEVCDGADTDCDGTKDNGCDVDKDGFCAAGKVIKAGASCKGTFGPASACPGMEANIPYAVPSKNDVQKYVVAETHHAAGGHPFYGEYWHVYTGEDGDERVARYSPMAKLGETALPRLGDFSLGKNDRPIKALAGDPLTDRWFACYGTGPGVIRYDGLGRSRPSATVNTGCHSVYVNAEEIVVLLPDRKTVRTFGRRSLQQESNRQIAPTELLHAVGTWDKWFIAIGTKGWRQYGRTGGAKQLGGHHGSHSTPAFFAMPMLVDVDGTTVGGKTMRRIGIFNDKDLLPGFSPAGRLLADRLCTRGDDCDDGDDAVKPGPETLCNGKDSNCNGLVDDHCDLDGDGYCAADLKVEAGAGCGSDISGGKGRDCDDAEKTTKPGAEEICDGEDNNCSGSADAGCDADSDTFCAKGKKVAAGAKCTGTLGLHGSASCAISVVDGTPGKASVFLGDLNRGEPRYHDFRKQWWVRTEDRMLTFGADRQPIGVQPMKHLATGRWQPAHHHDSVYRVLAKKLTRYDGVSATPVWTVELGVDSEPMPAGDRIWVHHGGWELRAYARADGELLRTVHIVDPDGSGGTHDGLHDPAIGAGFVFARSHKDAATRQVWRFSLADGKRVETGAVFAYASGSAGAFARQGLFICHHEGTAHKLTCRGVFTRACTDGDDCDDSDGQRNPGAAEVCNSKDDNCDGEVDGACSDGDRCTFNDTCTGGSCKPAITGKCDDGNPCTTDACKASLGCSHKLASNGTTCDDGNFCTADGACNNGTCTGAGAANNGKACDGGAGVCNGGGCSCSAGNFKDELGKCVGCSVSCGEGAVVVATGYKSGPGTTGGRISLKSVTTYKTDHTHKLGGAMSGAGDLLAVGATGAPNGTNNGSVQIFERQGNGSFIPTRTLAPPDGAAGYFGWAVAMQGEVLLASAPDHNNGGSKRGKAWELRRRADGTWQVFAGPARAAPVNNHRFGSAIEWVGDHALVGAWAENTKGTNAGALFTFARQADNSWKQGATIRPASSKAEDRIGTGIRVSFDGKQVAIGAPRGASKPGKLWVHRWDGSAWQQTAELETPQAVVDTLSKGDGNARFPETVAIDGDRLVASAGGDSAHAKLGGAIVLFRRAASGTWSYAAKFSQSAPRQNDVLASHLALRGDRLLIGCLHCDPAGAGINDSRGRAFLFQFNGTTYAQALEISPASGAVGDGYGRSVAFVGDDVFVGSDGMDNPDNSKSPDQVGAVFHFKPTPASCKDATSCACRTGWTGDTCDVDPDGKTQCADGRYVDGKACKDCACGPGAANNFADYRLKALPKPAEAAAGEHFGYAIAAQRNRFVAGAIRDATGGVLHGAVAVYDRQTDGGWKKTAWVPSGDTKAGGQVGHALSLQGDRFAAGASMHGTQRGAAWVYDRQGDGGWKATTVAMGTTAANDYCGSAISLSGDRLAVGCHGDDAKGGDSGVVKVVTRTAATGKWDNVVEVVPTELKAGDKTGAFGTVVLRGDELFIGSRDHDTPHASAGAVWTFKFEGGTWKQKAYLKPTKGNHKACGGIALDGDRMVIGCYLSDSDDAQNPAVGTALIRERGTDGTWHLVATLPPHAGAAGSDQVGFVAALQGDRLALDGLGLDRGGKNDVRAVVVYERQTDGTWTYVRDFYGNTPNTMDFFGLGMAFAGDDLVIGSHRDDNDGADLGRVYVAEPADVASCDSAGTCTCRPGWMGDTCDKAVTTCSEGRYDAGGTCTDCTAKCGAGALPDFAGYAGGDPAPAPDSLKNISGAQHGYGLAAAGDWVAAASTGYSASTGAVWMYQRQPDGSLVPKQFIQAADKQAGYSFGYRTIMRGKTLLITSPNHPGGGTKRGKLYRYDLDGNGLWKEASAPQLAGKKNDDSSGTAIDWDGDRIVVANTSSDAFKSDGGAVHVLEKEAGGSWKQTAVIAPSDIKAKWKFGHWEATKVDGDRIVVGAQKYAIDGKSGVGAAYVFEGSGASWKQVAKLLPTADPAFVVNAFAFCAGRLELDGDWLFMACPADDRIKNNQGAVIVFKRDDGGTWRFKQGIVPKRAAGNLPTDQFPTNIRVDGGLALMSCHTCSDRRGAAYLFELEGDVWRQRRELLQKNQKSLDYFGSAAELLGTDAIVGAYGRDNNGKGNGPSGIGAVYSFRTSAAQCGAKDTCTCRDGYTGKLCDKEDAPTSCGTGTWLDTSTNTCAACACGPGTATDPSNFTAARLGRPASIKGGDELGAAVAVSGGTLAAGARKYDADSGNAYGAVVMYDEQGDGSWKQGQVLVNPETSAIAWMGAAVGVEGGSLLAGAPRRTEGTDTKVGAVYVWNRTGGTWSHRSTLVPASLTKNAQFGSSISVSAGRAAVGAHGHAGNGTNAGAVYVLSSASGSWSEIVKLDSKQAKSGAQFGSGVSLQGDRLAAGAFTFTPNGRTKAGATWIYEFGGGAWKQVAGPLFFDDNRAQHCGYPALDGDRLLVGCPQHAHSGTTAGSGHIFERGNDGKWTRKAWLPAHTGRAVGDAAGTSVVLRGDLAVLGAPGRDKSGENAGAALLYARESGAWKFKKYLFSGDTGSGDDSFAFALALRDRTLFVGHVGDDDSAAQQGAVFTAQAAIPQTCDAKTGQCTCSEGYTGRTCSGFSREICAAGQRVDVDGCTDCGCSDGAVLDATSGTEIAQHTGTIGGTSPPVVVGAAVVADDRHALIGAPGYDSNRGRVDIFQKQADGSWKLEAEGKLLGPDKSAGYGVSIALDGNRAAVGAYQDKVGTDTMGRVHVVKYTGKTGQLFEGEQFVEPSIKQKNMLFGSAVGLSGSWLAVGAYRYKPLGSIPQHGAVFMYRRSAAGAYVAAQFIKRPDGMDAQFGEEHGIALQGDWMITGSAGGGIHKGAVVVFRRFGGGWRQTQLIKAPSGAQGFGPVAIDGDTFVVGARTTDKGGKKAGAAYVFTRSGMSWTQSAKLQPTELIEHDTFGSAVAIDAGVIAVGADETYNSGDQLGSVFSYSRDDKGVWQQRARVRRLDGKGSGGGGDGKDGFGGSVALAGDLLVVGADRDDTRAQFNGAAYLFTAPRRCDGAGRCQCKAGRVGKQCEAKGCGKQTDCDDGNICTIDSCDAATGGCKYTDAKDGSACSDGEPCTSEDCSQGVCKLKSADGDGTGCGNGGACKNSVCACGAGKFLGADGKCADCLCGVGARMDPANLAAIAPAKPANLPDASLAIGGGVAATDRFIVAGAPEWSDAKRDGAALVWQRRADGAYVHTELFGPFKAGAKARYGERVAAAGRFFAVGAPGDDADIQNGGSVYIYEQQPWGGLLRVARVTADSPKKGDEFGVCLAMSGDRLVVGAPYRDGSAGANTGGAWVFERDGGSWSRLAALTATGAKAEDFLGGGGDSVAIDGERIAVAATGYDRGSNVAKQTDGAVYIFEKQGSGWSQKARIVPADESGKDLAADGDASRQRCGAVALSGDHLLIGCPTDAQVAPTKKRVGSAYFYKRISGSWKMQAKVNSAGVRETDTLFAATVDLSGDRALIGCRGCAGKNGRSGTAELWELSGDAWSRKASLSPDSVPSDAKVGLGAVLVGGEAVVGVPGATVWGAKKAGAVYRFATPGSCSAGGKCLCEDGWSGDKCADAP